MISQPQAIKQRIAGQFSKAAAHYDDNAQLQWQIAQDALALMGDCQQSDTILDIGAGTGVVTEQLLKLSPQVMGLDLAQGMLQFAQQRNNRIRWVGGDAEALPLLCNTVDSIFSSMALQWSESMPKALSEIHRVLKPQGKAVLAIMAQGSYHEWHQCWQQGESRAHINQFLAHDTLIAMAQSAGFDVNASTSQYISQHQNVRSLLGSIKAIGANVVVNNANHQPLSKCSLRNLENAYEDLRGADNLLPLTYNVSFLSLHATTN